MRGPLNDHATMTMAYTPSVSLVLPMFNESEYVKIAVPRAVQVLTSLELDYEIIVIDDASTDDSKALVQKLIRDNTRIRLLCHARNRGLGAAVRSGFEASTRDLIVYADMDLPFDFSILRQLLPLMEHADIVHGCRVGKRESFKRTLYTWGYNFLVKKMFRVEIEDISFSLDIVRRSILPSLRLKFDAGFIATELLTTASYRGYRILQAPVPYVHRMFGASKLSSLKNVSRSLFELIRHYGEIVSHKQKDVGTKKVIINADDFGLTREVNRGILRAFREGIVTSTSLLPVGQAFEEAVQMAHDHPGLGVGIHLCLTAEAPVLSRAEIPSLVDKDGRFYGNWRKLFCRLILGKIDLREVGKELEAQILKVFDSGLFPTHIDSHQHAHLFPMISDIVLQLAEKYKIKNIRYPRECRRFRGGTLAGFLKNLLLLIPLRRLKSKIRRHGLRSSDHFWGLSRSGKLNEGFLETCFKKMPGGISEIMCHPGEGESESDYKRWGYSWSDELIALTSDHVKSQIKIWNIQLVSYASAYAK